VTAEGFAPAALTRLPSGLRIVSASRVGAPSTAAGVWVRVGGIHESADRTGISHFLEHLVFLRGTRSRPAEELTRFFDDRGAEAGAGTSQEATEFWSHCLTESFDGIVDVLLDIAQHPRLEGVDLERRRILDEIAAYDDDDEAAVEMLLDRALYGDHPLGRRALGEVQIVEGLTTADLEGWYRRWYAPSNIVVAAAGAVEHDALVDRIGALWDVDGEAPEAQAGSPPPLPPAWAFEERDLGQYQLLIAARGPTEDMDGFIPAWLLAESLGGTSSSRLWRRIGDELGLAYSVGAYYTHSVHAAALVIHIAMRPPDLERGLAEVRGQLDRLRSEPIAEAEVARARAVTKAGLLLDPRTPADEQSRIGRRTLLGLAPETLQDELRAIDAVTVEQVNAAVDLLDPARLTVVGVGPSASRFERAVQAHLGERAPAG
jgi:predicted Zn-dependent peptidase